MEPFVLPLLFFSFLVANSKGQLQVGFYSNICPQAEPTVCVVVRDVVLSNPNMAAVLLRLQFHGYFAEGCDGSILIDNVPQSEKLAFAHQGVRGFGVIERAKAQLEASCPGVVSCADIAALAARDAIVMENGPGYQVPTGMREGLVSNLSLAADMPDVDDSIQLVKDMFLKKGLTEKDLVLLSGTLKDKIHQGNSTA